MKTLLRALLLVALWCPPSWAYVLTRGASTGIFTASVSSLVVNVPAGTTNGDLMLLTCGTDSSHTITTPTGWSAVGSNSTNILWKTFSRTASSEPASYTVTFSGSVSFPSCQMASFYDNAANALSVDASGFSGPASATSAAAATCSPTQNFDAVIIQLEKGSGTDVVIPVAWTEDSQSINQAKTTNNLVGAFLQLGATQSYTNPTWLSAGSAATWETSAVCVKGATAAYAPNATLRSTTSTSGTAASVSVSVPAGVVNGDQLIMIERVNNPQTVTTPSGWVLAASSSAANAYVGYLFTRTASSEPGSYTVSFSASTAYTAQMSAFTVSSGTILVDGTPQVTFGAGGTTFTGPTLTTVKNGDLVMSPQFGGVAAAQTLQDGQTVAIDTVAESNLPNAYVYQAAAGTTSAVVGKAGSNTGGFLGFQFAIGATLPAGGTTTQIIE